MDLSYQKNQARGYVSFAADHRELDNIPSYPGKPFQENADTIADLSQVRNFLYLLDLEPFSTKQSFIQAVTGTNYNLLITDLFFNDGSAFTAEEVEQLRRKANGGKRLVVCYMSMEKRRTTVTTGRAGRRTGRIGWKRKIPNGKAITRSNTGTRHGRLSSSATSKRSWT